MATDIDNDGDKDLLIVWNPEELNEIFRSSLQLLINHGGRVFVDETVARVGIPPQAGMPRSWVSKIYTGYVNSDGCLDLLFLGHGLLQVEVWLNDCQGNFSPMAGPGLPKRRSTFIPLDFDGDGDTDFISSIPMPTGNAGTGACIAGPPVGEGTDYIDFAVLLNQSTSNFKINAAISDAWFFPDTVGQGFFIIVWEDSKLVFLAWFTYDTERPPQDVTALLGEPGHRWLTALGPYEGDTALLDIFLSSGMVFDSAEPPVTTEQLEGATIEIVWSDCKTGLVKYNIPTLGLMGEIPIERIVEDKVAACEAAQAQ